MVIIISKKEILQKLIISLLIFHILVFMVRPIKSYETKLEKESIEKFNEEIPTIIPPTVTLEKHKPFNLGIELLAGTLAGVTSCILFYPLECIEAQLQVLSTQTSGKLNGGAIHMNKQQQQSTLLNKLNRKVKFQPKTPIETAKYIYETSGIKGFYRGLSPTVLGNAVNWGIYFSIYRFSNHWWDKQYHSTIGGTNDIPPAAWIGHSFSAITAGLITTAIVNPFWVLKIRLATSPQSYPNSMIKSIQTILVNEGIGAFWKGVGISFLGVSEGLVQFVTYEWILNTMKLTKLGSSNNNNIGRSLDTGNVLLGPSNYLMAGAMARLVAGILTYPYLLIRSTLQAEGSQFKSMKDAIKSISSREGISGFYKGIVPNLIRSIPPAACMLYMVEFFRNTLSNLI